MSMWPTMCSMYPIYMCMAYNTRFLHYYLLIAMHCKSFFIRFIVTFSSFSLTISFYFIFFVSFFFSLSWCFTHIVLFFTEWVFSIFIHLIMLVIRKKARKIGAIVSISRFIIWSANKLCLWVLCTKCVSSSLLLKRTNLPLFGCYIYEILLLRRSRERETFHLIPSRLDTKHTHLLNLTQWILVFVCVCSTIFVLFVIYLNIAVCK